MRRMKANQKNVCITKKHTHFEAKTDEADESTKKRFACVKNKRTHFEVET